MKVIQFTVLLLLVVFTGCDKYEVNSIPNNNTLDDPTISNETKNSYINRLYIRLLDRKADSLEFKTALSLLNEAPSEPSKRKEIIDLIILNKEFYHVRWKEIREILLDGADTSDINYVYQELYTDWTNATGNNKIALEYEWKRMETIL